MQHVERLDRTKPPPGYTLAPAPSRRQGKAGPATLGAMWAHYERDHDPPGLVVWPDAFAGDDVWWWGDEDRNYGPEEREEADARAAAWAWYWNVAASAAG